MNRYYQNELEKIREQAIEFAKAYPTIAPQLSQASTDPDVERILEGVAFLSAQIRQKIDDDFPEFAQGLLKQIFPHCCLKTILLKVWQMMMKEDISGYSVQEEAQAV